MATSGGPFVEAFHDAATFTWSYVAYEHAGGRAAIIDPVLDYDPGAARTSTRLADRILDFVHGLGLQVDWILETHAHADHLTAADYLKGRTGARTAIGQGITKVQARFKALFALGDAFVPDGSQFDRLLADGDAFALGALQGRVLATPGHTDDSLTYLIGDAAFVGDTIFAPDVGTARTDFPGGDAHALYRSLQAILGLPAGTRLFLCHDYPPAGRAPVAEASIEDQRQRNVHVGGGIDEAGFVTMRRARDAALVVPRLILPALQVNIRAGKLPEPDANGIRYLRLPLDQLGAD